MIINLYVSHSLKKKSDPLSVSYIAYQYNLPIRIGLCCLDVFSNSNDEDKTLSAVFASKFS